MAKSLHTHRGTCQACGRAQAVDNTTGLVAKHGYTVDWGYFNGVCTGSGKQPAERKVSLTRDGQRAGYMSLKELRSATLVWQS